MAIKGTLGAFLFWGLALSVVEAQSAEIDSPPTAAEVLKLFEDVALGGEYLRRSPTVVKWAAAPTFRIETLVPESGRDAPDVKFNRIATAPARYEFLKRHIGLLGELTGMPLELLPAGAEEGGDIVVSIVPRTRFSDFKISGISDNLRNKLTGPGRCYFLIWPDGAGNIVRGHVVIADNRDEARVSHCFVEETTQAMGLPNDSRTVRKSVFNDSYAGNSLTDVDRLLVKTLYDPAIAAGARRDEALRVAETVIDRYIGFGWFLPLN